MLAAQVPVLLDTSSKNMPSFDTKFPSPQHVLDSALQVVPASPTALTSTDTMIYQLVFNNTTAGPVSVTVSDHNSKDLITAAVLDANSTVVLDFPEGQFMTSGVNWSASAGSSITGSISAIYI